MKAKPSTMVWFESIEAKSKEKIGILTELMMAATFAPNGSSTKIDKALRFANNKFKKKIKQ